MSWKIERQGHVAVVTMSTSHANLQNEAFEEDLHEAFDRLESEFVDCSVVLCGTGQIFSAGVDFDTSLPLFASGDREAIGAWLDRYRMLHLRVFTYPRPTVAAINGHAFAGGLVLALACDYRLASAGVARIGLNEVPTGIPMPLAYLEIIRYAIGTQATRLSLFGQVRSAEGALQLGVVHEVVEPDVLLRRAVEVASHVGPECFEAYAHSKRVLQAPALDRVERLSERYDGELPDAVCAPTALRAQAMAYRLVKGEEPPWEE
jgi:enoyl-CoA hydratase